MADIKQPAREKTPFNDYRLPHPKTTTPINGGKYPAQALWDVDTSGNVVFKVQDGVFGDQKDGRKKQVKMSFADRGSLFNLIRQSCSEKDFTKAQYTIKKKDWVFSNGRSAISDEPIVQAVFTVIRDDNGLISFGYSKGDFKAKFDFVGPNDNELMFHKAGEYVEDAGMCSRLYAMSYVDWIQGELTSLELKGYVPPKPREPVSGGGNSGSNYPEVTDFEDVDF